MKEQASGCGRKMMNHEHYLLNLVDLKVRFQWQKTLLRIQHPRCCWQFLAGCCGDHPPEKTRQLQQTITLEAPNMKLPDVIGTSESFPITISKRYQATIKSDHMIHNVISADIIVSHCRCLLCQQKEVWLRLKCNLQGHVRGRNFASPNTRSNGKNRL